MITPHPTTTEMMAECAALLPTLEWERDEAEIATGRPTCAGYIMPGYKLRVAVWITPDGRFGAEMSAHHERMDDNGTESYCNTSGDGTGNTIPDAYAEASRAYARACAAERPAAPEMQP